MFFALTLGLLGTDLAGGGGVYGRSDPLRRLLLSISRLELVGAGLLLWVKLFTSLLGRGSLNGLRVVLTERPLGQATLVFEQANELHLHCFWVELRVPGSDILKAPLMKTSNG